MRPFRDLEVHKVSHALTLDVYAVSRSFPRDEAFGLTSQLRRASTSIPTNIAEGSARGGDREFRQFLYIALGSAAELEYLLMLARDLGYVSAETHEDLDSRVASVKRMLVRFIARLSSDAPPNLSSSASRLANSQQPTANSQQPTAGAL